ncbi:hypothetical protein PIB30_066017 [Stylosanthes scabra]|uniref:Uncharacterized protein n=1 Tax=Stylosanthes scabra TaxID=79078 RepID=A0ABU6YJR4_9FABA|nr:hypothetical protein [Stylosanthes scabra]
MGSSPIYDPCGSAESTQKGGTGCLGDATTFARGKPYSRFISSSRRARERQPGHELMTCTRNFRHSSFLLFVMRPPVSRRGRPRIVRHFAPDHFVLAISPPRPTPPTPLPQPAGTLRHCTRVPTYVCTTSSSSPPPSAPVATIPDDIPSEPSQDLSTDGSDNREILIEGDSSDSADSFDDLVSPYDTGTFLFLPPSP